MALEKQIIVDLIEVTENGCVRVRTKTAIVENGQQVSGSFHRHIVAPGDDYSKENDRVKAVCKATHTPAVIAAYKASLAAA
jgi:hypothetical protein